MAAINQRIPNFLGGVSQQPDSIKFPGQLRVCDNAVPDVTFGLTKRPPGEFVKKLTNATSTGQWFEIVRDKDEKFLVQINAANSGSTIKAWALTDIPASVGGSAIAAGTEITVNNQSNAFNYLNQTPVQHNFAYQTIQDTTIIANPAIPTAMDTSNKVASTLGGTKYCFVRLDTLAYNTEYVLYIGEAPTMNTYKRVSAVKALKNNTDDDLSWTDGDADCRYAGQKEWQSDSGSGYSKAEGNLLVNCNAYINDYTANYDNDGSGQASDFLGHTANYRARYTVQCTLKDGGRFASGNLAENTALASPSIEGISYTVRCAGFEEFDTYEGVQNIAYYRTPKNPDEGNVSIASVLKGIKDKIGDLPGSHTATIIGNGLFIQGDNADKISFLGGTINEGMGVVSRTITDVSKLPAQCKHGFVVEVANSENTDSDDYYLKFLADSGSEGPGRWEETPKPDDLVSGDADQLVGLKADTMPHALVWNRSTGQFDFKEIPTGTTDTLLEWKNRQVGDMDSNPSPSFIGSPIQNIFFHRNRLGFVSGEKILLGQPHDFFNLFTVSAITTSDDNPIDITVSDTQPAYINHTLPINKGVMMFSDNGQFLLFTESDIFSPKTARLKKVSSYECNSDIDPVDMGTSIMWASSVGPFTRTFEAVILDDDVPPKVIEQTRVVPEFIHNTITTASNSSALGIVTYGKQGDSNLYHYKYFDSGDRRDQSAWFSWTLTGALEHALYTGGNFYTVTKTNNEYILSRHEYVTDSDANRSYTLGTGTPGSTLSTARWFEACLDYMEIFSSFSAPTNDLTSLTIGHQPADWTKIYLVVLSGNEAGVVIKADSSSSGTTAKFKIDLSSGTHKAAVGYRYDTLIELPTYYSAFEPGKYDLDADLRISGINFEMGVSGPMEFELSSKHGDIDTYTQYESGMLIGTGQFSEPPAVLNKSVRVPIQRKNDKYTLKVKIPDPFTTSLISASWDGRYNTRRHVRQ